MRTRFAGVVMLLLLALPVAAHAYCEEHFGVRVPSSDGAIVVGNMLACSFTGSYFVSFDMYEAFDAAGNYQPLEANMTYMTSGSNASWSFSQTVPIEFWVSVQGSPDWLYTQVDDMSCAGWACASRDFVQEYFTP